MCTAELTLVSGAEGVRAAGTILGSGPIPVEVSPTREAVHAVVAAAAEEATDAMIGQLAHDANGANDCQPHCAYMKRSMHPDNTPHPNAELDPIK